MQRTTYLALQGYTTIWNMWNIILWSMTPKQVSEGTRRHPHHILPNTAATATENDAGGSMTVFSSRED